MHVSSQREHAHVALHARTHTHLLLLSREPTPPAGPPPRSLSIGTAAPRCRHRPAPPCTGRSAPIPPAGVLQRWVHTCVLKDWPLYPRGMRCPHSARIAHAPRHRHAWDPRNDACVPSEEEDAEHSKSPHRAFAYDWVTTSTAAAASTLAIARGRRCARAEEAWAMRKARGTRCLQLIDSTLEANIRTGSLWPFTTYFHFPVQYQPGPHSTSHEVCAFKTPHGAFATSAENGGGGAVPRALPCGNTVVGQRHRVCAPPGPSPPPAAVPRPWHGALLARRPAHTAHRGGGGERPASLLQAAAALQHRDRPTGHGRGERGGGRARPAGL